MPKLIAGRTLINYDENTPHVVIPSYVEAIAAQAFYDSGYIVTMEVPDSVKRIGNDAFRHCYAMRAIHLPARVEEFGTGVFRQCRMLEAVALPEGVCHIDSEMFAECTALNTVSLPRSVSSVAASAFCWCNDLVGLFLAPEQFDLLPEAVREVAALTFLTARGAAPQEILPFVRENEASLVQRIIAQGEASALKALIAEGLLSQAALSGYMEASTAMRKTELTAMLLEAREQARREEETLSWDPFA